MSVSSPGGRTARRPRPPSAGGPSSWLEDILLASGVVVLTTGLVLVASRGILFAIVACAAAAFLLALVTFGRERIAIASLMGAFFLAPMYLGISPSESTSVTPPDLAMLVGGVLLLPTLVGRRVELPILFVAGIGIMMVSGVVAATVATSAVASLFGLATWLISMAGLAVLLAVWRPPAPLIAAFAWSYVAGQMFSTAGGIVTGHVAEGRWYGLSHHPNVFGAAGMMSVALLLFLIHHHRSTFPRVIVCLAGAVAVGTVVASGGRAATVVVAVLIVMYPVVERSAVSGFLLALLGGIVIVLLPVLIGITGEDSALARLTDASSTSGADLARSNDREAGIDRFLEHFWTGSGSINFEIFYIHDTFLQVAVALGVFGVAGFLLVVFTLARPLFSNAPLRRLSYTTWAFIGFAWTTPGMQDRTLWIPMSLAILAALRPEDAPMAPTGPVAGPREMPGRIRMH